MSNKHLVMTALAALTLVACDKAEVQAPAEVAEAAPATLEKPAKRAGSDDRYATKSPDSEAVVGASTRVEFRIEPRGDLKINKEYPWKIEFESADGVELGATELDKAKLTLTDSAATIPVELTAANAGKTTLKATGSFSVCNPQRCDILRDEPLEFTVVAVGPQDDSGNEAATDESEPAEKAGETATN